MTKTERKHHRTFVAEIERRGGETGINHAPYQNCAAKSVRWREVQIVDTGRSEGRKVWLLRVEGWRYYSRRFGSKKASVAYLCGYDDNGPWAARVPGTLKTAAEACDWLVPALIHKARAAGRKVVRQGDVYAIETARRFDGNGLERDYETMDPRVCQIGNHTWYPKIRCLVHSDERSHTPLHVPFPARFVAQSAYRMERGGGIGAAD